jgi:hypothetical protein
MTMPRSSSSTSVLNTIGLAPSSSAVRLMRRTASWAFSTLEMNGKVTSRTSSPANCASTLWPTVSDVTPVWSDTK